MDNLPDPGMLTKPSHLRPLSLVQFIAGSESRLRTEGGAVLEKQTCGGTVGVRPLFQCFGKKGSDPTYEVVLAMNPLTKLYLPGSVRAASTISVECVVFASYPSRFIATTAL